MPSTSDANLSDTFAPEIVSQNESTSYNFTTALSSDQYTPSMFQDDLGLLDVTEEVCNFLFEAVVGYVNIQNMIWTHGKSCYYVRQ